MTGQQITWYCFHDFNSIKVRLEFNIFGEEFAMVLNFNSIKVRLEFKKVGIALLNSGISIP